MQFGDCFMETGLKIMFNKVLYDIPGTRNGLH